MPCQCRFHPAIPVVAHANCIAQHVVPDHVMHIRASRVVCRGTPDIHYRFYQHHAKSIGECGIILGSRTICLALHHADIDAKRCEDEPTLAQISLWSSPVDQVPNESIHYWFYDNGVLPSNETMQGVFGIDLHNGAVLNMQEKLVDTVITTLRREYQQVNIRNLFHNPVNITRNSLNFDGQLTTAVQNVCTEPNPTNQPNPTDQSN